MKLFLNIERRNYNGRIIDYHNITSDNADDLWKMIEQVMPLNKGYCIAVIHAEFTEAIR